MDKEHILAEIKRTAETNGGKPLGKERFEKATGIRWSDWYGKHWARWGDAVAEAGLEPNSMQGAYDDDFVLDAMVEFIKELGRYPVAGEIRMRARNNADFPSHTVIAKVGRKVELARKIVDYCEGRDGFDNVVDICRSVLSQAPDKVETESTDETEIPGDTTEFGHIYLLKSGKHYKIGRSNSVGRRGYELAIQLPERAEVVHTIATDDPVGIEAYWHNRFKDKRLNGEWFNLSADDIRAFKRRKFM